MKKLVFFLMIIFLVNYPTQSQIEKDVWSSETTFDFDSSFDVSLQETVNSATTLDEVLVEISQFENQTNGHLMASNSSLVTAVPEYLISFHFVTDGKNVAMEKSMNRLAILMVLSHAEFAKQHSTNKPLKSVPVPSKFIAENINLNMDEGFGPRFGL